jgi:hypothetical protein
VLRCANLPTCVPIVLVLSCTDRRETRAASVAASADSATAVAAARCPRAHVCTPRVRVVHTRAYARGERCGGEHRWTTNISPHTAAFLRCAVCGKRGRSVVTVWAGATNEIVVTSTSNTRAYCNTRRVRRLLAQWGSGFHGAAACMMHMSV